MCVTDFKEGGGGAFPPSHPWAAPKRPILDRVKTRFKKLNNNNEIAELMRVVLIAKKFKTNFLLSNTKFDCFKQIFASSCIYFQQEFLYLLHPTSAWKIQKQPPELFYEKDALKNVTKLTVKHLCQSFFFNKVACLSTGFFPWTLRKFQESLVYKTPPDGCFWRETISCRSKSYIWMKKVSRCLEISSRREFHFGYV